MYISMSTKEAGGSVYVRVYVCVCGKDGRRDCHIPVQHLSHAFTYTLRNSSLSGSRSFILIILHYHYFASLSPITFLSCNHQHPPPPPPPLVSHFPHPLHKPDSQGSFFLHPHVTAASTIITIKTNTPLHTHSSPPLPPSSSLLQPHTHHHHHHHHHTAWRPSQSRPTPEAAAFQHTTLTVALSYVETECGLSLLLCASSCCGVDENRYIVQRHVMLSRLLLQRKTFKRKSKLGESEHLTHVSWVER